MSRDSQHQTEQRSQILHAAARLIAAEGYHGMSMRGLARATGKSLATFYNYYASKEEILFSLQKEAFENLIGITSEALRGVTDAEERLYVFIFHHVRTFAEHPDVMRILVHEAASLPADQRRLVRRLKEGYFQMGRDIVRRVVNDRSAAKVDDGELERITYSLFGMLNWIYGWYEPLRHGRPRDLAHTIYRLALHGLTAGRNGDAPSETLRDLDRQLAAEEVRPLLG